MTGLRLAGLWGLLMSVTTTSVRDSFEASNPDRLVGPEPHRLLRKVRQKGAENPSSQRHVVMLTSSALYSIIYCKRGPLAQLAEQLTLNQ